MDGSCPLSKPRDLAETFREPRWPLLCQHLLVGRRRSELTGEPVQVSELTRQLAQERSRVQALQADVAAGTAAIAQLEADSARDAAAMAAQIAERARAVQEAEPMDEAPAAGGSGSDGDGGANAEAMTVQEIKEWLTEGGFESEVWALATRKTPRVKKADWISLMQSKQG